MLRFVATANPFAVPACALLAACLLAAPVHAATLGEATATASTQAGVAYRPAGSPSEINDFASDASGRIEDDVDTGVLATADSSIGLTGSPLTSTASAAVGSASAGLAGVSAGVSVTTAGGYQNSGSGTAEALAEWWDGVVIDRAGLTGQSGYLTATLVLDGSLYVEAFGQDAHNLERAFATLSVIGEGLAPATGQASAGQCLWGAGYCAYAFAGATDISGAPENGYYEHGSLAVVIPFTFGQEFYLGYTLKAKATAQAISWDEFAVPGDASGLASFASTLRWGGIDGVFRGGGIPVGDFSLASGSGLDYRQAVAAVPLPAAHVLLVTGFAAIGAWGRRRRARAPGGTVKP